MPTLPVFFGNALCEWSLLYVAQLQPTTDMMSFTFHFLGYPPPPPHTHTHIAITLVATQRFPTLIIVKGISL